MAVDFPSSYPAAPVVSAGKPVGVQTLQEAFAAALRHYGTEKSGTSTGTMLEVLRPVPHTDGAPAEDRRQQRHEQQRHIDRNDVANLDQKLLEKSEIRSNNILSEYQDRIDRNGMLQNEYKGRVEQNELQQSAVQASVQSTATPTCTPVDVVSALDPVPNRDYQPPQQNVPAAIDTNPQPLSANTPNSLASTGQVTVLLPGGNVPALSPTPVVPQVVQPQTFTVFTSQGRFGQAQGKTDDKNDLEEEDEEFVEGTETKKTQPFAEFETIRSRPYISRHPKAQVAQPGLRQAVEKPRERPTEVEPEQVRNDKALEEFLNASPQDVAMPKKGKANQPNPSQYLNRIAAACEAASHYAPIRIKLNLDHLGTLTLRFYHKADKLTLRFETPSKESAQFVNDHLNGLRTILSKRNVNIAQMEIT